MPDRIKEIVATVDFTMAAHKPDLSKSRQHYLDLLYTCAVEEPRSARHAKLYAAELHGNGFFEQAICEFNRFLNLDECINPCERGYAYRMMSRSAHCMGDSPGALDYARKCVDEDPSMRESWCTLAWECGQQELWFESLNAANVALTIEGRGDVYLTENNAWGWLPHGLAAFALNGMGMLDLARKRAEDALTLEVDIETSREKLKLILNPPEPDRDQ